jgi:hypothetical protein
VDELGLAWIRRHPMDGGIDFVSIKRRTLALARSSPQMGKENTTNTEKNARVAKSDDGVRLGMGN